MVQNRQSRAIILTIIFSFLTGYFVWNGSWHDPAVLEIKGTVSSVPTRFDVAWDSGNGVNNYEMFKVKLNTVSAQPANQVIISYTGKKNSASLSENFTCRRIIADDQELPGSWVQINADKPRIDLEVRASQSILIELETNNRSGIAEIEVNGASYERDLYIANVEAKSRTYDFWLIGPQNQFTVQVPLPRYQINDLVLLKQKKSGPLTLDSVDLKIKNKESISLLGQPQKLFKLHLGGISQYQRRYFQWERFGMQLVFAALSTWLISGMMRVLSPAGRYGQVVKGKNRTFILFFLGAVCCYLVWLLIFWPGVMSVDSLKIWRAAQLPEVYLNDHPILNVFLYSYLFHIWNNPAVVPIFHILATSMLVAMVFQTIYQNGASLPLLIPFYLFAILSIPIGLYNTVLWKDIPFALLIVFWGYSSAELFQQKQNHTLKLSKEKIFVLILLLLALGMIRHNGLIYLIFIPVFYVLLGLIRFDRRIWLGILGFGLLSAAGAAFMTSSIATDSAYLITQGRVYLQGILGSSLTDLLYLTWQNYWGMLDINQTNSKWDKFHYFLRDRYAFDFLRHARWQDVYPYIQGWQGPLAILKDWAMKAYWMSYEKPFVYLSWNPLWALVLFPLTILLFRWFPLSAIFSSVVLVQVLTLTTLLNVMNWRYYYFVCLASCFIIPMICFDIARKRKMKPDEV